MIGPLLTYDDDVHLERLLSAVRAANITPHDPTLVIAVHVCFGVAWA